MEYIIYRNRSEMFHSASFSAANQEYLRLQGIYPAVELFMVGVNEHQERSPIHSGYWQ